MGNVSSTFQNYEISKISVENPNFVNLVIIIMLFFISVLFLGKRQSWKILDRNQTNQLRGISILSIIVGHLWVHVSSIKPSLLMGGEGVALFLVLSGFGLTRSFYEKKPSITSFFIRRIERIMFPYWFITFIIIVLDYVILARVYSPKDIVLTLFGINISSTTYHIDYVRWYITLLLFWYIIFGFLVRVTTPFYRIVTLMLVAVVIFFCNSDNSQ